MASTNTTWKDAIDWIQIQLPVIGTKGPWRAPGTIGLRSSRFSKACACERGQRTGSNKSEMIKHTTHWRQNHGKHLFLICSRTLLRSIPKKYFKETLIKSHPCNLHFSSIFPSKSLPFLTPQPFFPHLLPERGMALAQSAHLLATLAHLDATWVI